MTDTIRALSRRDLFRLSLAGTLTTSPAWFEPLRVRAEAMEGAGRKPAKQCVLLWLGGGPSQAHSFDPKPGEHVQLVKTTVPGLQFSEYLPRLAERMRHLVLVKTMNHGNFGHGDAVIWSQTGYKTRDGASTTRVWGRGSPTPSRSRKRNYRTTSWSTLCRRRGRTAWGPATSARSSRR